MTAPRFAPVLLRLAFGMALVAVMLASYPATAQWDTHTGDLQPVPALTGRVVDATATLSAPERQRIEAKLADWEAKSGNQLVVALVPTTQPEPIEAFSLRLAEAWKIGRRGQDNGALLVVAKNDKKLRIEVGYGLEGTLTDVTSRRIIAESIAPQFSQGRFAEGIEAGVDRIIQVVGSGQPLPADAKGKKPGAAPEFDFGSLFVLLFIVVPVLGAFLRSMFGKLAGSTIGAGLIGTVAWFVLGSLVVAVIAGIVAFFVMIFSGLGMGVGRRGGVYFPTGGGWGGGSWGGGGGGGFSGGGGSFGGGGASGGWN